MSLKASGNYINRRKYPIEPTGHKNEWKGLIDHYSEITSKINEVENDIKNLRQKELKTEYEARLLDKLNHKKSELQMKKDESQSYVSMNKINQKEYLAKKENDRKQKVTFAQDYESKIQQKKNEKEESIKIKNEFENNEIIKKNKEKNESEIDTKIYKELQNKLVTEERLQKLEAIKGLQQKIEKEKKEYQDLCQNNSFKEKVKDYNYNTYYDKIAERQNQYQELHKNTVLPIIEEKERKLEAKIKQDYDQYNKKLLKMEIDKNKHANMINKMSNDSLKYQMEERKKMDMVAKLKKQEEFKERMDKWKQYNSSLNGFYKDSKNSQSFYKGQLDQQNEEVKNNKLREKRMTPEEKKINVLDLQAYKTVDKSLYSMIPGFTPQVGAYSTKNMSKQALSFYDKEFKDKVLNTQLAKRGSNVDTGSFGNTGDVKFYSPQIKNNSLPPLSSNHYQSYQHNMFRHNPITNPLPYNIQNPYILQQLHHAHLS